MYIEMGVVDVVFFFFNDTATTEIYTLSLHDALPIWHGGYRIPPSSSGVGTAKVWWPASQVPQSRRAPTKREKRTKEDRKSTRLNSSHANISYAVFCLKKKKSTISLYYTSACLTSSHS